MCNYLPQKLIEKQEAERRKTVDKVLRAISDVKTEGCRLNIKNLMAYTGLSRSVFAKPHVRAIIEEQGILISKNKSTPKITDNNTVNDRENKAEQRIQLLIKENEELKRECELLRRRLFLLIQNQQDKK